MATSGAVVGAVLTILLPTYGKTFYWCIMGVLAGPATLLLLVIEKMMGGEVKHRCLMAICFGAGLMSLYTLIGYATYNWLSSAWRAFPEQRRTSGSAGARS